MDDIGTQYHSYRCALENWIESEYPFLHVERFEEASDPEHYRRWEIDAIRDSALFIGVIFEDSEEVIFEIEQAIKFKNPVFLFFYSDKNKTKGTWGKFVISMGIKASKADNWNHLVMLIRVSIDNWLISVLNEKKGKSDYAPPEPMEPI